MSVLNHVFSLDILLIQIVTKLFDLVTKSVFVSRDVVFHETVFPFASTLTTFNSDGCLVLPKPISDSSTSARYSP